VPLNYGLADLEADRATLEVVLGHLTKITH
jgi:hypothetical protein